MADGEANAFVAKTINRSLEWLSEKVGLPERLEVSAFMIASLSSCVWQPPFDAHMIHWTREIGDEVVRDFNHRQNCLKSHCIIEPWYNWRKVVSEGIIRITVVARRGDVGYMCPRDSLDPEPVKDVSDREDPYLLRHNVDCGGIARYGKFDTAALEQVEAEKLFVFRSEQEIPLFYTHWTELTPMKIANEDEPRQEDAATQTTEVDVLLDPPSCSL